MGAGTGLLTRPLLADPQWGKAIAELRVSEPVDGMREVIQQSIQDPRVTVSNNTFENSGLPDGWADVILIATASGDELVQKRPSELLTAVHIGLPLEQ